MKVNAPEAGNGNKYQILAEINMIPLIDVSLVLLIIFMVMTPFLVKSKIKINLPPSASSEKDAGKEDHVEIQVEKDGGIYVDGRSVAAVDLEKSLRLALHDPASQGVVIQADREVPFERFIVVADAARKVGVAKFSIAVKPAKGSAPPPRPKRP